MPHLTIQYTGALDPQIQMADLCHRLAITLAAQVDGEGKPVFPLAGTRVLAYPAPYHAVAGGAPGQHFMYLNFRITPGRVRAVVDTAGDALIAAVKAHVDALGPLPSLGITLHIDEGNPVYEGKYRPAAAETRSKPA
jgi:5-carboxymethyl-2-hydroxymuconate isomerase